MTEPTLDWIRIQRAQDELDARYEAINQRWQVSGLPLYVLKTPDFQTGWRVLQAWRRPYGLRWCDAAKWDRDIDNEAITERHIWADRIHVFSHMNSPLQGHCLEHAAIEEEGQRAILDWWQKQSVVSTELPQTSAWLTADTRTSPYAMATRSLMRIGRKIGA